MKFTRRRWSALVATDIVVRFLIWAVAVPLFFVFGPVFSCLHLVLLGLSTKVVSRFNLQPVPAFAVTMIATNVLFFCATYWFLYLFAGHERAISGLGFFGGFQVGFNILLVLVFWLDQRLGGDAASRTAHDLK